MTLELRLADWGAASVHTSNSYISRSPDNYNAQVYNIPAGVQRIIAVNDTPVTAAFHRRVRFNNLSENWLTDTEWMSSTADMKLHPNYAHLLNMGRFALREILIRMQNGDVKLQWFLLLKNIAGQDPVPPHHRGRVPEMMQSWMSWGKQNGLV